MLYVALIIGTFLAQHFLVWWAMVFPCFLAGYFLAKSPSQAFGAGFAMVFIVWATRILSLSIPNGNLLGNRIGQLFFLPDWQANWVIMLLASSFIGGFIGGITCLSGQLFQKKSGISERMAN